MWKLTCLFLIWFYPHTTTAQFDFGSIFNSVFSNGGFPFGGGGLGFNIQQQLAPLSNLGATIQNQVQQNLMPVFAMGIRNQMANGVGGTTVATYFGNIPRILIIQNGMRRICNGPVEGPRCYGSLEPFEIINREDLCFAKTHAQINDRICLSAGQINVQAINGQVTCESVDGLPTLLLTMMQYRNMCGNRLPWEVVYRYYPNPNDPRAIPVPHPNPHVRCLNNEPGVCEFEGDSTLGGGGGSASGMFISSNSGGFQFNSFSGR